MSIEHYVIGMSECSRTVDNSRAPCFRWRRLYMYRMTDAELLALLDDTESDRVERKESFKGDVTKKARQAVCAFANDLPSHNQLGVLFIGAKDDGSPADLSITDDLLRSLADIKTDGNILPLPVLTVEKRTLKSVDMVVVTVMPSDMPPVKYEGRIWIRTGPRRSIANAQEERVLNEKRRYKNLPFDICPIPTAKINDLSRVIFENEYLPQAFAEDVLQENGRTYEERLASCRMIVSPRDSTPTVMGLLGIGKSPQDFLPGAYIQFLRIDGLELADPVIDSEEISGSVVEVLRRTEEKLKAHNKIAVDITVKSTHQITTPYPQVALQQILYNAVLHRTYEGTNAPIRIYWFNDRIEIMSPGGPYGNVTSENFGQPGVTDYRNPNIADLLKTFGFIQAFGRGIATARRAMDVNGNPPLELRPDQTAVLCILRGKS
jgi:ATP-dependent DNA helicase RecG